MIKKFGVKNFFCFKEGIEVDFTFDGNVPKEISKGLNYSPVIGIKGANGSGKTNIIKVLDFLRSFCTFSADTNIDSKIYVDSFGGSDKPTEFYIDFDSNGRSYIYELSVNNQKVFREALYKIGKRKSLILERVDNEIINYRSSLKEIADIKLRENASVISMSHKYNFKSEMLELKDVREFFLKIITNVDYFGFRERNMSISEISKRYGEKPDLFKFVKEIILFADSGLKDIQIYTRKDDNEKDVFYPMFIRESKNRNILLTIHDESSGTKSLYETLYLYWLALSFGGVLALDEFDIHLHSLILPKILNLFFDKKINKRGAQFLFTAHNTEIIDELGKYRTILVNKENNESYCYRLDEIPGNIIRNDRSIIPLYLKGKIGGVPVSEI